MIRILAMFILTLTLVAITSSGARVLTDDPHKEIREGDTAVYNWQVLNDEENRLIVTMEWAETNFSEEVSPIEFSLWPTESESGHYSIGPCEDIEVDITIELFLNVRYERQGLRGGGGEMNTTFWLTITNTESEVEDAASTSDDDDGHILHYIFSLGIISTIILLHNRLGYFHFFTPYYYKIRRDDIFLHESRNNILHLLATERNGKTLNEMHNMLDLNRSTTRYHLRKLMEYGVVVKGNDRRYYLWKFRSRSGESVEDAIWDLALSDPEIKKAEIARRLGISRQNVSYHMNKRNGIEE